MLTFQNLYETYRTITKDTSTSNVTLGKLLINDTHKNVCGLADFTFLDDEWYASSVASQESYRLPHNYQPNSLITIYVDNGGTKYFPEEISSTREFDFLSAVASSASYPQFYSIFSDYIKFYPTPSDTSWTIHLKYRKMPLEMTADNYTTGTVSITQNTRTLTGSGTTFTAAMEGRSIKLGDGLWYPIETYSSTTELLLGKSFEGTTISGGSYIIGELPIIPDGFQTMLLYPALEHYFMMTGEENRSAFYKGLYDRDVAQLKSRYTSRTSNQVFTQGRQHVINPNDYPLNLHQ